MVPFSWVVARALILIIFIPVSIAWTDFFREYVSDITGCPRPNCKEIPILDRLAIIILITAFAFVIVWFIYRFTTLFDW
jgi:hypothetical protein